jgi:hypothetical protein
MKEFRILFSIGLYISFTIMIYSRLAIEEAEKLKIWILIREQFGNTFGMAYKYQFATFSFEKIGQLLIMG